MKKKLLLLIFIFFVGIVLCSDASAANRLTCKYNYVTNTVNESYKLIFYIEGNVVKAESIIKTSFYEGTTEEKDVTEIYKNNIFNLSEKSDCPKSIGFNQGQITFDGVFNLIGSETSKEFVGTSLCPSYKYKAFCENSEETGKVSCLWNEKKINGKKYEYCNVDNLTYVACGDTKDIPSEVPALISFAVNFLKIVAPLILIFIGIISLIKAVSSSNEDEMKKAQKGLVRKLVPAVLVFFVISIVQFVISLVVDNEIKSDINGKTEATNLSNCLNCFLNNDCENNIYYRSNIGGEYKYYSLKTGEEIVLDE